MPTPPAVYGEFGQTLAFAERTMSRVLRDHLAQRDVQPETWYALKLVATRGPGMSREELSRDLGGSPNLDADSTRALLARLEEDGLLRGGPTVDLTEQGERVYRDLRDYISGPTVTLLGQFDVHDVETTVRTLRAVTARATEI